MQRKLAKMVDALNKLRELNPEMPAQTALSLIYIATGKAQTVTELQKRLGVSLAGASRNVYILSAVKEKNQPGLGVVEQTIDPMDRRYKRLSLTKKGERFMQELLEVL